MSASLLEDLSGLFSPDLIRQAAAAFGEQPHAVGRGLEAAIPLLFGSIAHRAGDPGFATNLFDLATHAGNDRSLLRSPGALIGPNAAALPAASAGSQLLGSLFGSDPAAVRGALASHAEVKTSTAASLLGIGAPVVLALLGSQAAARKLDGPALASALRNQKQLFAAALPASLQKFVGIDTVAPAVATAESASSRGSWFLPALLLVGIVLMLPYCSRQQEPAAVAAPPAVAAVPVVATPAPEAPAAQAVETPLATLYFEVGKSELQADAGTLLAPIVAYVQANAGSLAIVSGFHDPTGNQAANAELAKQRAFAVKAALVAAGLTEAQIELQKPAVTEGGGSLEEARRVEVSVR